MASTRGNTQEWMLFLLSWYYPKDKTSTREDSPILSKDKVGYTFQLHQFVLRQGRIYLLVNHAVISTVVTINLNYQNLDVSYIHQFVLGQGRIYLSFAPIRPKTRSDIPYCPKTDFQLHLTPIRPKTGRIYL